MSISLKLALRYFKSQKKRNTITIFSIVMAVALFASTGILIMSFQNMFRESHAQTKGDWHYRAYTDSSSSQQITSDIAKDFQYNILIDEAGVVAEDNYIKVGLVDEDNANTTSANDYTFYNLKELDSAALKMFPYESQLVEGRMPQNSNEMCISNGSTSFWTDGNPIGKQATFDIGTGIEYSDDGVFDFTFNQTGTRTLTIVGVYQRFRFGKVPNVSEAFTLDPIGNHSYSIYFKVNPVSNYKNSVNQIMSDMELNSYAKYQSNDGYLRWIGQGDDNMRFAFIGVFAILLLIIIITMTTVIKNSFTLSYSEKISQFGLLSCIGCTQKQIRKIVLFESLITWGIAQPFGIIIAIIVMKVVISVISKIELDMVNNIEGVISIWPIVIAMTASLITTLISSYLPAKKAGAVSPVEAIKGNIIEQETSPRGKTRMGILGFSYSMAKKNINRHKGRYRTTLASIIVSVVLFVTVAGLSIGLNYSLKNYAGGYSAEFFLSSNHHSPKEKQAYLNLENELKTYEEVELVETVHPLPVYVDIPEDRIPKDYEKTFSRYFMIDTPYIRETKYGMLGSALKQVDIVPIQRENYNTLVFEGNSPTYDDLVNNNEVLICQTETFRKNGSMSVIKFSDFTAGDVLNIGTTYQGNLIDIRQATIAGELKETPWYVETRSKGYIVVPQENILLYLSMYSNATEVLYYNGMVSIKAKDGMAETLSDRLQLATSSSFDAYNGFALNSPYEKIKELTDTVLIINIFIYGFITVIVLMCSLNIFNTIATNLANRSREIAMLRCVGMDKKQLFKSLMFECLIYSIRGTAIGGIIGVGGLYALTYIMNRFFVVDYQNPVIYLLIALVFSIAIAFSAGIEPIRKSLKGNIIDALRDID